MFRLRNERPAAQRSILFSFEADFAGRVKARPADRDFGRKRSPAGLHAAVILFIALPEAEDNIEPG
jgi:hypothetical protein